MRKIYLFTLALTFLCLTNLHSQVWENVGNSNGISKGSASYVKIISDHLSNYYVCYFDGVSKYGEVQMYDGNRWSYLKNNDNTSLGASNGILSTMAVDSENNFYYTYRGAAAEGYPIYTKVYSNENNTISTLPTISPEAIPGNLATAVNRDSVYVLFNSTENGIVQRYNGTDWVQVGAKGFGKGSYLQFHFLDVVIDSKNTVYVTYAENDSIYVLKNDLFAADSKEWTSVSNSGYGLTQACIREKYTSSIAIDSADNLYVNYFSFEECLANVLKYNGSKWERLGDEDFYEYPLQFVNLVVTKDGVPYMAGTEWGNKFQNIAFAYDTVLNKWNNISSGHISEGYAEYSYLDIDENNGLNIAYYDRTLAKVVVRNMNFDALAPDTIQITLPDDALTATISEDNGFLQVSATILPVNATQAITWSMIEGGNKATVDQTGKITATTSNGEVLVKAAATQNLSIFDTLRVAITNQISDVMPESIKITMLNQTYQEILNIGDSIILNADVAPAEADQSATWSVISGEEFISVDAAGVAKGLAEGHGIIRAQAYDVYADIHISVYNNGLVIGTVTANLMKGAQATKGSSIKTADDIIVGIDTLLEAKKMVFTLLTDDSVEINSADINILSSINNGPDKVVKTFTNIKPSSQRFIEKEYELYKYIVEIILPESVNFTTGQYWINPSFATETNSVVYWNETFNQEMGSSYYINAGSGWYIPDAGEWDTDFYIVGNLKAIDHDVAVTNVNFSTPRYIPVRQAQAIDSIEISVKNNSSFAESTVFSIASGDNVFASKNIKLGNNLTHTFKVPVDFTGLKADDLFELSFNIAIDGDQNLLNNSISRTLSVSDSTYVNDYADGDYLEAVGSYSAAISLGSKFTLFEKDTLKYVNLNFAKIDSLTNEEFKFCVYKIYDDNTFDDTPLLQELFTRGRGGESTSFKLTPTALEPGSYCFCVEQLNLVNYYLTVDLIEGGTIYEKREGYFNIHTSYGSLHIRPSFSQDNSSTISVTSSEVNSINLFPNPVVNTLNITSNSGDIKQVSIYNVTGNLVYVSTEIGAYNSISTEELESGVYFAKVTTMNGDAIFKFLKE